MEARKINTDTKNMFDEPIRVLAVDDEPAMLMLLQAYLDNLGYESLTASDGNEAWNILQKEKQNIDAILLDQEMPGMKGLEVLALMKQDPLLKTIPVIMQTAANRPENIKQGIDAGVFYYLTKPINDEVLSSVLLAAVCDVRKKKLLAKELKQHKTSFYLIQNCYFKYQTLAEAESLSCFIANCYPNAESAVAGLAELLVNAVEHGNLGISYEEKTNLINEGAWRHEIERRMKLPEYKDKFVDVVLKRKEEGIYVAIRDQGKGFEWHRYMQVDPARAQDNHGRGIAQANAMSFDRVTYNDAGNEVRAFVSFGSKLDW